MKRIITLLSMLAAMLISAPSLANNCEITVVSNDMMQFDKKSITVDKSCKEFKVTLTHSGKLPKTAMGHNWVLTKASDARGVAADGMGAGIDNSYVKKRRQPCDRINESDRWW